MNGPVPTPPALRSAPLAVAVGGQPHAQRRLDGEGEAAAFLRALVIEEYGLLLCLLGVTQGARWVASRLKAPA